MHCMAARSLHLKLFRRQAVDSVRQRWLGEVVVATPPTSAVTVVIAAGACVALCVSSVTIRVPEHLQAAGVMLPAGRIIRVLAPRAGIVGDIAVQDGDSIHPGQALLRIMSPDAAGGGSSLDGRWRSLERELAVLDDETAVAERAMRMAEENNHRRAALARRQFDAAGTEAALLTAQLEIAKRQLERGRRLGASGGIATQQLDTLTAGVLQARLRLAAAGDKRYALERELTLLDEELRQLKEVAAQQDLRRARDRERVQRDLLDLADERRTVIVAPGGGVAGVVVAQGATVRSGELLLQIVERDADLQAHIYISADDAGRVQEGQAIELRLRAYPHRLYGTWSATVQHVSMVPLPADSLPLPLSGAGSVYELRAVPDRASGTDSWPLVAPGATFEAEVVTRRWPLYRWLLRGGRVAT